MLKEGPHTPSWQVRFMVMGNMFHTDLRIDARFDLKGSSHGRATDPGARDAATTLKDLDIDMAFKLEEGWRERLARQLGHDCDFLQKLHIMDYSLLLGVSQAAHQDRKAAQSDRSKCSKEGR